MVKLYDGGAYLVNGMEIAIDGKEYSDGRKFKTREY